MLYTPPQRKSWEREKVTQFLCLFVSSWVGLRWSITKASGCRRQGTHAKQIQYRIGPSSNDPPQDSQVVHSLCCCSGIMPHTNESMSTHLTTPGYPNHPTTSGNHMRHSCGITSNPKISVNSSSDWSFSLFMKILQRSLNSEIGITISFLLLRIVAIYQIWMDPLPMRSRMSMALLQGLPVVVHFSQLCLQLRSILVPRLWQVKFWKGSTIQNCSRLCIQWGCLVCELPMTSQR